MITPLPGKRAISELFRESKAARRGRFLPTGIERLDEILGGGLPRGELAEMVGSISSGKTSLLLSVLAQTAAGGEVAAYIDAFNALDPAFAESAGVDLKRLLWVRCDGPAPQRIARALKAADVLVRSKGFAVVVLDLENVDGARSCGPSRIPQSSWFRLKQTLRGTPTALILVGERARSGSAASMVLGLQRSRARWRPPNSKKLDAQPSHARALRGIASEARLLRGKRHGHVTIYCDF